MNFNATNTDNAMIKKFTIEVMKLPILTLPNTIELKSGAPKIIAIIGMMISATNDSTILLNAAPITTPIARSSTFPLSAMP